jgi:hypothetical protein
MSLLPGQILPPTAPLGTVNADGQIIIEKNWWLLLYNMCQQILAGSGATLTELVDLAVTVPRGPDYERQLADLRTALASLPNPAGRIATLEKRVADLEKLVASSALKVWN